MFTRKCVAEEVVALGLADPERSLCCAFQVVCLLGKLRNPQPGEAKVVQRSPPAHSHLHPCGSPVRSRLSPVSKNGFLLSLSLSVSSCHKGHCVSLEHSGPGPANRRPSTFVSRPGTLSPVPVAGHHRTQRRTFSCGQTHDSPHKYVLRVGCLVRVQQCSFGLDQLRHGLARHHPSEIMVGALSLSDVSDARQMAHSAYAPRSSDSTYSAWVSSICPHGHLHVITCSAANADHLTNIDHRSNTKRTSTNIGRSEECVRARMCALQIALQKRRDSNGNDTKVEETRFKNTNNRSTR